jgi:hypothetical protein
MANTWHTNNEHGTQINQTDTQLAPRSRIILEKIENNDRYPSAEIIRRPTLYSPFQHCIHQFNIVFTSSPKRIPGDCFEVNRTFTCPNSLKFILILFSRV